VHRNEHVAYARHFPQLPREANWSRARGLLTPASQFYRQTGIFQVTE